MNGLLERGFAIGLELAQGLFGEEFFSETGDDDPRSSVKTELIVIQVFCFDCPDAALGECEVQLGVAGGFEGIGESFGAFEKERCFKRDRCGLGASDRLRGPRLTALPFRLLERSRRGGRG